MGDKKSNVNPESEVVSLKEMSEKSCEKNQTPVILDPKSKMTVPNTVVKEILDELCTA